MYYENIYRCSCNNDIDKKYYNDCEKLVSKLFKNNNDLVFGACPDGLMGMCYREAIKNNRRVIGISPEVYKFNFDFLKCSEKIISNKVASRTTSLINSSDAMLFLPGGTGTICELFTSIEGKRGKEFNKPIIIYNSCHYYDSLIDFLQIAFNNGFISREVQNLYYISDNIDDIINYLN